MSGTRSAAAHEGSTAWVGWIVFAAAMLMVDGAFNIITGLVAIFSDDVYVQTQHNELVLDVTAWGWTHLVLGILLALVGYFILRGALWAAATAALLVMVNMVTQLLLLPTYPLWSLVIILVDTLVLWALLVHGDEIR
jgi:hypothetical protein